jgi:general secretion pathway protein C
MPLLPQSLRAIAERSTGVVRTSLEIGLVLVLAVQAARLVWIVTEPKGPFGSPPPEAATVSAFTPFAPRTELRESASTPEGVALVGVRVGSGTASAIIAAGGKQSVYWIGEEIAPGTVLKDVAGDHVLLAQGNGTSRLELAALAATSNTAASMPPYMLAPRTPTAAKPALTASVDTKKLLEEAGLRPRTQNGQITGYTLLPRGAGEMLGRAGLAAGDVLVALNGNRLTPERYSEIEQELTGTSQVQLTVERGSETRTITLQTGKSVQ